MTGFKLAVLGIGIGLAVGFTGGQVLPSMDEWAGVQYMASAFFNVEEPIRVVEISKDKEKVELSGLVEREGVDKEEELSDLGLQNLSGREGEVTLNRDDLLEAILAAGAKVEINLNFEGATFNLVTERVELAAETVSGLAGGEKVGVGSFSGGSSDGLSDVGVSEGLTCLKNRTGQPIFEPVIMSEVAWMGGAEGATREWIELYNSSDKKVELGGWRLQNEKGTIDFEFEEGDFVEPLGLFLMKRGSDESAFGVSADAIYTGALANTEEVIYLFNNECGLVDMVMANPKWMAGDNFTKQTMERDWNSLGWYTSAEAGGTPGRVNSSPAVGMVSEIKNDELKIISDEEEETKDDEEVVGCINVNSASKEELMEIVHIGNVISDRVIENRPFSSWEDFKNRVSGIGDVTLNNILEEGKACL